MSQLNVTRRDLHELCKDCCCLERVKEALSLNNRGHEKYMQVEFDAAIKDYTEALKLSPSLAVAYYNRGTVLYRLGDFDKAAADMKSAAQLEPSNTEFTEGLKACISRHVITQKNTEAGDVQRAD